VRSLEVVAILLLLTGFALTLEGEVIAEDRDFEVFRVNTGEIRFDYALVPFHSAL
jgi:hypothetical protein